MTKTPFRAGAIAVIALAVTVSAQRPPLRSGFDPSTFDTSVRPQDNLYRYVNGRWLDTTEIPDDRVWYSAAIELVAKADADIRAIVSELAAQPNRRPGSPAQQVGDLYASMQNEAAIEAKGLTPLEPELRAIEAIDSIRALAERAGHLSATTTSGPFFVSVGVDPRNPADRLVHVSQGGLLLEREHYLGGDDRSKEIRAEYEKYLERIFTLTNRREPKADATALVALEIELARAHVPAETLNLGSGRSGPPMSPGQLKSAMPGFDWTAWARPQGVDRVAGVVLVQPSFFQTFAKLASERPLSTWKAWLAARYITALSPYVSGPASMARFDFFGTFLTGQKTPIPRPQRGVGFVNAIVGDAVGRLYVERHFSRDSRTRVERIVDQVTRAYRQSIARADWLTPGTKAEALAKLARLTPYVGFPDVWRDYRGLDVRPDDLFGNLTRSYVFDNARRMTRISRPDERGEWPHTPQTVNAFYVSGRNEIVLPAAILQPPYFDPTADEAVNFGAIGSVIGHELGHALDDTGRWYDAAGAIRNWWKPEDERAYARQLDLIRRAVEGYPPTDGLRPNAALVLTESAGDLVGLSIAYRAYQNSLEGKPAPVVDGLTGDERFFFGWARMWRTKERPEYRRQLLLSSRYAPADFRANATVGHIEGFYQAFRVAETDALFIAPARRVRLY